MSIIIQKENGDKVIELAVLEFGQCAYKRSEREYVIISAEKFAAILDWADERGYYIFDYYDD